MKTSRRFLSLVLLLTFITAAFGAPPAAAALKSWTVRVLQVSDGDTFYVDTNGDGARDYTVRVAGLNTPEGKMSGGRFVGQCHGEEAFRRVENLIEGKRVVLRASSFTSVGSEGRKLRFVETLAGMDIGALLLREGLAVPYPSNIEPSRNASYINLAKGAAAKKINVWDTDDCGKTGPYQDVALKVRLRWDANGSDETNLNGEYARIENPSDTTVPLNGWVLRDSAAFYYRFGERASVPARGSVTVHTGRGQPWGTTNRHYYWGRSSSIFANERTCTNKMGTKCGLPLGDGAYLYDPQWDLRAYMSYPCLGTCYDPVSESVEISNVTTSNPETVYLTITNNSLKDVDLSGYLLDSKPWNFEIPSAVPAVPPGGRAILKVNTSEDPGKQTTPWNRYWGIGTGNAIFGGSDDYVELRRMEGHTLDREAW